MGITFSANEVLEMAERIEENGASFYRRAAGLHSGSDVAFLESLAAMEDDHKNTFAEMRANLTGRESEQTAADPYLEANLFLNELAKTHGGEGSPKVAEGMTGEESLEDILRTAISLEQNSIAFYGSVKEMVPRGLGGDRIDAIIDEEKGHVAVLVAKLRELRA
jgi:rubrerythrin